VCTKKKSIWEKKLEENGLLRQTWFCILLLVCVAGERKKNSKGSIDCIYIEQNFEQEKEKRKGRKGNANFKKKVVQIVNTTPSSCVVVVVFLLPVHALRIQRVPPVIELKETAFSALGGCCIIVDIQEGWLSYQGVKSLRRRPWPGCPPWRWW
jgi:hypothetical protein